MSVVRDPDGTTRIFYNDTNRTVTTYGPTGVITDVRPYDAGENAAADAAALTATYAVNYSTLVTRAKTALTNNATYLALPTPTTAQAVAQVAALTRQVNALIRIAVNDLTATD